MQMAVNAKALAIETRTTQALVNCIWIVGDVEDVEDCLRASIIATVSYLVLGRDIGPNALMSMLVFWRSA